MPSRSDSSSLFGLSPDQEYWRFRGLEAAYDEGTIEVLDQIRVMPGWRTLEVGAGGGSIAVALHSRAGSVYALDNDTSYIEDFRSNTFKVIESDLVHALEQQLIPDNLDLVHCRLFLDLFESPEAVVGDLSSLLRSGGWLFIEEFDDVTLEECLVGGRAADLHKLVVGAKRRAWESKGFDGHIGRKLPGLFSLAGLDQIESRCSTRIRHSGTNERLGWQRSLEGMYRELLQSGLKQSDYAEYAALLESKGFQYFAPLMVRVTGRKR